MRYGVLSDIHDNFQNLKKALQKVKRERLSTCFYLGDFCAPSVVEEMLKTNVKWICVWGNVDGAKAEIISKFGKDRRFDIVPEQFREFESDLGRVFLTHYPLLAQNAAYTGEYIACFYGHRHEHHFEKLGNGTLLANPGEIAGFKTGEPSIGIWDSNINDFEIVFL